MDEFTLIEKFFAARSTAREDVVVGIGDDAAVTRVDAQYDLVIATDTIVAGTHFPPGTPARALGHRCLAVNLSDLAAMGAEPMWCTLALSLPQGSAAWVDEFSAGFMALAERHGVGLIGGDTVRGPLAMTVTVHGRVKPGTALRRAGAGPGQAVYVTGCTGRASAGLDLLVRGGESPRRAAGGLIDPFLYPAPRVREGRSLIGLATALIDLSDGLHVDLSRLLRSSGVGARLQVQALPLAPAAVEIFGRERAVDFALTGGDDYELCFTIPPDREQELWRMADSWECGITRIGETCTEQDIEWREGDRVRVVEEAAFRHFSGADE